MVTSSSISKRNSFQTKNFSKFHQLVKMDIFTLQLTVKMAHNAEFIWLSMDVGKDKKLLEISTLHKQDIFNGLPLITSSLCSLKWENKVLVNFKSAGTPGDQMML